MSARKENSTNNINRKILSDTCGLMYALEIIGGRWKMLILYKLEAGRLRFSELKKRLPNITSRMLTLHLKELEHAHLIKRHVYPEVPVRVEYELAPAALTLTPIWHLLKTWGDDHKELYESSLETVRHLHI